MHLDRQSKNNIRDSNAGTEFLGHGPRIDSFRRSEIMDVDGQHTMPPQLIAKFEHEGRQVRPTRDTNYVVSYWALEANGVFKNFERY